MTVGVMEEGVFLMDFFGWFLPTALATDVDTRRVVFTLVVIV
ncbi:hypothetical protein [Merdimonas faecis]|nr:hypothetical protein [Merdimonas faecis]